MGDDLPYPMGIDPRLLELNRDGSYDHNTAPQVFPSNKTQLDDDSWPSIPISSGSFMPPSLAGPHVDMGAFDVDMVAVGGDFQINGALVENKDSWCLHSQYGDHGGMGQLTPAVDLNTQQALPLFTSSSLDHMSGETSGSSSQDLFTMAAQPAANGKVPQTPKSMHAPVCALPQARRTQRTKRSLARASRTRSSKYMTSPMPRCRQALPPQKRGPTLSEFTNAKTAEGVRSSPSTQTVSVPSETTGPSNHTTALREAIASFQESIKPFSPFSRRKATDLIKDVVELVDKLEELAVEEEKYGNASSDDDGFAQPSTAASSQDSLSNSELVNVDSDTDNTSVSSSSHLPVAGGQDNVSVEHDQRKHHPCLQCGHKSLYYCTREGCNYSIHSFAEWRRHESSQRHSQRERWMCLECPYSPPATDLNGDPVCEFCLLSFSGLSMNLTAHYLQCQAAQKSGTTYGRHDRLMGHLRTKHQLDMNVSQIATAGKYTIDCQWPRNCGFCGVTFTTWEERMGHIAGHFEDGLDMSSWKNLSPTPKDSHPGFKPRPKDGDDSDDDMDDNDDCPSGSRAGPKGGSQDISKSSGSSQTKKTTQKQGRGASNQGGRRSRQQVSPANSKNEVDSNAISNANNVRATMLAERMWKEYRSQGIKTPSVALDRYLSDVEEPFQVQAMSESSTQDTSQIDVTIKSEDAHQQSDPIQKAWREFTEERTRCDPLFAPMPRPMQNQQMHQNSSVVNCSQITTAHPIEGGIQGDNFEARQAGIAPTSQYQALRRRRESYDIVKRRRRDNINERIQELSLLVPIHRLEDEKARKALDNVSLLSPPMAELSEPNGFVTLSQVFSGGPSVSRATTRNLKTSIPTKVTGRDPKQGDILNGAATWTRDLMRMLSCKVQEQEELLKQISTKSSDIMTKMNETNTHHSRAPITGLGAPMQLAHFESGPDPLNPQGNIAPDTEFIPKKHHLMIPRQFEGQDMGVGIKSELLEKFRSHSKPKRYELKDIYHHVVDSRCWSRFIQKNLEMTENDSQGSLKPYSPFKIALASMPKRNYWTTPQYLQAPASTGFRVSLQNCANSKANSFPPASPTPITDAGVLYLEDPLKIPSEKMKKALELYNAYKLAESNAEKDEDTHSLGLRQLYLRSRSSPKHRISRPGSVRLVQAKAALKRYLGSCSHCRSRRVPCPLEHHDIQSLENLGASNSEPDSVPEQASLPLRLQLPSCTFDTMASLKSEDMSIEDPEDYPYSISSASVNLPPLSQSPQMGCEAAVIRAENAMHLLRSSESSQRTLRGSSMEIRESKKAYSKEYDAAFKRINEQFQDEDFQATAEWRMKMLRDLLHDLFCDLFRDLSIPPDRERHDIKVTLLPTWSQKMPESSRTTSLSAVTDKSNREFKFTLVVPSLWPAGDAELIESTLLRNTGYKLYIQSSGSFAVDFMTAGIFVVGDQGYEELDPWGLACLQCHTPISADRPPTYTGDNYYSVESGNDAIVEYFSEPMLREQLDYTYGQPEYHHQSPQSYASWGPSTPCPEGQEREWYKVAFALAPSPGPYFDHYASKNIQSQTSKKVQKPRKPKITSATSYLLPPLIGLHNIQHQRTTLPNSEISFHIMQLLSERKDRHSLSTELHTNYELKVRELGLARDSNVDPENADCMTKYVGSRYYAAPEVISDCQRNEPSVDVWSFSYILVTLLTSRPSFREVEEVDELGRILKLRPIDLECASTRRTILPDAEKITTRERSSDSDAWILDRLFEYAARLNALHYPPVALQSLLDSHAKFLRRAELFPIRYRARCHGLSAAYGKLGAVITQVFPQPLLTKYVKPGCQITEYSQMDILASHYSYMPFLHYAPERGTTYAKTYRRGAQLSLSESLPEETPHDSLILELCHLSCVEYLANCSRENLDFIDKKYRLLLKAFKMFFKSMIFERQLMIEREYLIHVSGPLRDTVCHYATGNSDVRCRKETSAEGCLNCSSNLLLGVEFVVYEVGWGGQGVNHQEINHVANIAFMRHGALPPFLSEEGGSFVAGQSHLSCDHFG